MSKFLKFLAQRPFFRFYCSRLPRRTRSMAVAAKRLQSRQTRSSRTTCTWERMNSCWMRRSTAI